MRISQNSSAFRDLDRLFRSGVAHSGDGALLERFISEGDDSAFEALVDRHGPMVLGVCRRILASPHDADDAFQATFIVLARKAARLRAPDRLGPWLYGVATRVARKARMRGARHQHDVLTDYPGREHDRSEWSDVMPIVDDELGRLSSRHRDVLVLCLLEGASPEEAARRLGCPIGTVKSRLARGRQTLRDRLIGRGVSPSVALTALSPGGLYASPLSPSLIRATLAAIASSATAPGVAALTRGVTLTMFSKPTVTSSLIAVGLAAAGITVATWMSTLHAQGPGAPGAPSADPSNNRRDVQVEHLKQIGLAFHNYYAATNRLPAVAIFGADGLPNLSWRVAILPYLGENELYKEFRLDEPWDSPHNKALIGRMPAVFETPAAPASAGQTRIRGFGGNGTIFDGPLGVSLADVTDGTSNTLLVAIADEPTPWTKPGELPFVAGRPVAGLDHRDPGGYLLGMVDGSVHSLDVKHASVLPAIITRAGGEVFQWPEREAEDGLGAVQVRQLLPTAAPTPQPTPSVVVLGTGGPTPVAPIPPMTTAPVTTPHAVAAGGASSPSSIQALDQRMRRLEDRLELILKRLDAMSGERSR